MIALLGPIESLMEYILFSIHNLTGLSWAWSIIALTAVVRIGIMPLTVKQTVSMKKMQELQPYLKQLQERYKNDRQELNQRMLEFYRDNNANPLASCLPLLFQIPVFIALFYTLNHFQPPPGSSQNLSFLFGFVDDITVDINKSGIAGATLVVFYVLSQVFSSMVMSASADPRQRRMFYILPIVFVPFILSFPVGVMLYWITTNLWTLGQYLVISALYRPVGEVVMPRDDRKDSDGSRRVVKKSISGEQANDSPSSKSSAPHTNSPRRNKRRR